MIRLYLDVCCFNRPFDDQTQARIRLETEAVLEIVARCEAGDWQLLSSEALELEVAQTPDGERRESVELVLEVAKERLMLDEDIQRRGVEIQAFGFQGYDALHIAFAESANADAFLSTDDRLLRRANRLGGELRVSCQNPVSWLMQQTEKED